MIQYLLFMTVHLKLGKIRAGYWLLLFGLKQFFCKKQAKGSTYYFSLFTFFKTSLAQLVKNPPANAGDERDEGSIPEKGRFLPGKPHGLRSLVGQSMGLKRVRHNRTHTYTENQYSCCKEKSTLTPVVTVSLACFLLLLLLWSYIMASRRESCPSAWLSECLCSEPCRWQEGRNEHISLSEACHSGRHLQD